MLLKSGSQAAMGRKHCLQADSHLPFDDQAGLVRARLVAEGKAVGQPRNALDMIIAAVSETHGRIMVMDNEKDFRGIGIVNPLRQSTSGEVQ